LHEKYSSKLSVIKSDSGLHIVCEAVTEKSIDKINEDSKKNNILLNIVSQNGNKIIFSLGYSSIETNKISEFTDILGDVLFI
jgi:DNA-binding transcriptional MocR family regulator